MNKFLTFFTIIIIAIVLSFMETEEKESVPVYTAKKEVVRSDWLQFGGGPSAQSSVKGDLELPLKLNWKVKVGTNLLAGVSVKGDTLIVGSGDNKIYALNTLDGSQRWSFEALDTFEATPLILDGKVYIGSADYFFYCLDYLTGKKIWSFESDGKILGSANWSEVDGKKVIIAGSYDGYLYAFDAETGTVNWKYDSENYVNGTPLVDHEKVFFGGCDEQLHGVKIKDGSGEFTYSLDAPVPGSGSKMGDNVYIGTHGGRFLCYDLLNKKIRWEITDADEGFYATGALNQEGLILAGRDKWLRYLNPLTGEEKWKVNLRSAVDSTPIIIGEKVVVATKGGKCLVYSLKDGKELWQYDVGSPVIGSLGYASGVLYISVKNGFLYAFGQNDA